MTIAATPRKKQGSDLEPVFIGDFAAVFFGEAGCRQHKKAGQGFCKESHAARAANQIVEPEAGRMIQTQVINLVNGVVPCPSRIADATSDRVGACGTKLTHGFKVTPLAGRSPASLPVHAQFTKTARTWQARLFLSREGSPAGDWFANHALQRTPRRAFGLFDNVWPAPRPARAESLSLGR